MTQISRVLVALVALFNIVLGLGFLLDPAGSAQRFLLEPLGTQGMATLRADFTAFFVVENGRPVGILHMHDLLRLGVA